jgi:hypothetical protein
VPGSDQSLVDAVGLEFALHDPKRLLADPMQHNFSAGWRQILDVMPGLARRKSFDWRAYLSNIHQAEDRCRRAQKLLSGASKDEVEETMGMNVELLIENARVGGTSDKRIRRRVMKYLQDDLHARCMVNWIYVFDEEGVEADMFLKLWLDAFGQLVRSKRLEDGSEDMFNCMFLDGSWGELEEWQDADIGEQHLPGGPRGHLYFLKTTRLSPLEIGQDYGVCCDSIKKEMVLLVNLEYQFHQQVKC